RTADREWTILESPKPVVRERQPVSTLGDLPFVDDVEADCALLTDHPLDGLPHRTIVVRSGRVEIRRGREAPHVRRQNLEIGHRGARFYFQVVLRLPWVLFMKPFGKIAKTDAPAVDHTDLISAIRELSDRFER